ncbi:hypothetical protein LP419_03280 [Massilia sp. H-1]|nr:hypothetical protein LP419_03280 [Massilia sp. H-1]
MVRPEVEFYLTARNADPDLPLRSPVGRSGRAETSRQAYSIDAVNESRSPVRRHLRLLRADGARRRHPHPRDRR